MALRPRRSPCAFVRSQRSEIVAHALIACEMVQIFGGRKKMSSIAVMDYTSAEGLHAQVTTLTPNLTAKPKAQPQT